VKIISKKKNPTKSAKFEKNANFDGIIQKFVKFGSVIRRKKIKKYLALSQSELAEF